MYMPIIDEILDGARERVAFIHDLRKKRGVSIASWNERIIQCEREIHTLRAEIKRLTESDVDLQNELVMMLRIIGTQDPVPQTTGPALVRPEPPAAPVMEPEDIPVEPEDIPVASPTQLGLSTRVGMSNPKLALTCEAILATFGHNTAPISLTDLTNWYSKVEPRAQPPSQRDAIYRATRHLVEAGHLMKLPTHRGSPAQWRFTAPKAQS